MTQDELCKYGQEPASCTSNPMDCQCAIDASLAQTQEPVAYDKTEMNCFVQDLYDKKMQEGKHGHYETMFHVVHQAIKKVPPQRTEQEPVACAECERLKDALKRANGLAEHFERAWYLRGDEIEELQAPPPQRTWVDLTDEEIQVVAKQARSKDHAVTLTNKLLREKNT